MGDPGAMARRGGFKARSDLGAQSDFIIGLNAVIVAVTHDEPRILTVDRNGGGDGEDQVLSLPFGPLDPYGDRTLELGLRGWVQEQTGLGLGYVEQLYTFGDRDRDPQERRGGPRVLSVAYLALVREEEPARTAQWRHCYEFLPWEDWRHGRPALIDRVIAPRLSQWVDKDPERGERMEIVFGLGGMGWDEERVLDRYELLYEAGLVDEAIRDRTARGNLAAGVDPEARVGRPMALDHRRILATALGRLRGKLKYRPVVFELVPPTFRLLQLQRVVEALAGRLLHKQNFRRLVERGRLVEGTGRQDLQTGGRPAELFRFRHEVLRERPTPGVGLPGVPLKQPE